MCILEPTSLKQQSETPSSAMKRRECVCTSCWFIAAVILLIVSLVIQFSIIPSMFKQVSEKCIQSSLLITLRILISLHRHLLSGLRTDDLLHQHWNSLKPSYFITKSNDYSLVPERIPSWLLLKLDSYLVIGQFCWQM